MDSKSKGGAFFVPLNAYLRELKLNLPTLCDLGFCAVNELKEMKFEVKNVGKVPCEFMWKVPEPITFSPSTGQLDLGQSISITIGFTPMEACVVESIAILKAGMETYSMTIKASGKYSYIHVSSVKIDFGSVLTGSICQQTVQITNRSPARVTLAIEHVTKNIILNTGVKGREVKPLYFFTPNKASMEPGEVRNVIVTYTPNATGTYSNEFFRVVTPSDKITKSSGLLLTCSGQADGHEISLTPPQIQFSDLVLGRSQIMELVLRNHSNSPAVFSFMTDNLGSFKVTPVEGVISAQLSVSVVVQFNPQQPINYYKRLFCLIQNQAPLYVDLVGTAFFEKRRPAPLTVAHIAAYHLRCALGLRRMSTEQMLAALTNVDESKAAPYPSAYEQLFVNPSTNQDAEAMLSPRSVEFGFSNMRSAEPKPVYVTNNCCVKVTCIWDIAASASANSFFVINPVEQDIRPGETVEFKISFIPNKVNYYYDQAIDCYIYYKSNRSFRLVDERVFTPPLCLSLSASGHTFAPGIEHFLPNAEFSVQSVDFPACRAGTRAFLTVGIKNSGDTPVAYKIPPMSTVLEEKSLWIERLINDAWLDFLFPYSPSVDLAIRIWRI